MSEAIKCITCNGKGGYCSGITKWKQCDMCQGIGYKYSAKLKNKTEKGYDIQTVQEICKWLRRDYGLDGGDWYAEQIEETFLDK